MIIVSQDKETIMNFDNSTTIRLYKYSTGYEIEACLTNGHISTLEIMQQKIEQKRY